MMTKFDGYIERMQEKRKQHREDAINYALLTSLRTKTREEVLQELWQGLTFIAGVSEILPKVSPKSAEKQLVY